MLSYLPQPQARSHFGVTPVPAVATAGSDAAVAAFERLLPCRTDWKNKHKNKQTKKSAEQQGSKAGSISKLGGQCSC